MRLKTTTNSDEATFMPRPDFLEIRESSIGQGLFTKKRLRSGEQIATTHVFTTCSHAKKLYPDGWIRSGVGSWYNQAWHENGANCRTNHFEREGIELIDIDRIKNPNPGDMKILIATENIQVGYELLVKRYTLYEPICLTEY